VAAKLGVAVGLGVLVGVAVLVGVSVTVAVGWEVLVAVGSGATAEQADNIELTSMRTDKMALKVLRCIYPPG